MEWTKLEVDEYFLLLYESWENWQMGFGFPWPGVFNDQPIWFYSTVKHFKREWDIKESEDVRQQMKKHQNSQPNKPQNRLGGGNK